MPQRTSLLSLGVTASSAALLSVAALAADPYQLTYTDTDPITLSGKITAIQPEAFTLDFGDGLITVEMNDWDFYNEARLLSEGSQVTVYGRIDDSLYEARTIEADSVYSHDANTFYYASDADEEGDYAFRYYFQPAPVVDGTWLGLSGTVRAIDGREFTLDLGNRTVSVDTIDMGYNPLDDTGLQQVDVGDRVYVSGTLDVRFLDENELHANTITLLERDATKRLGEGS